MLYKSPVIPQTDMPYRSEDAKALFEYVHREHDTPSAFVKDKTGKHDRREHNAEYQMLLRLLDKKKPFTRKMWNKLEGVFGVKSEDIRQGKTNTIIGDGNIQDSHTTGLSSGIALDREAELLAENARLIKENARLKDQIIELLQKQLDHK